MSEVIFSNDTNEPSLLDSELQFILTSGSCRTVVVGSIGSDNYIFFNERISICKMHSHKHA